jgi:ABC-type bacteriocin/lantibiotic exporter with double-glycine peptidase domain
MQTFKKLVFILTASDRKSAIFLLIMIIIMALLEVIGVASILPFITVLTNPSLIETNPILKWMFQFSNIFGVENYREFSFVLGVFTFLLLIISIASKALTSYMQIHFKYSCSYNISKRLVEGYLNQKYNWFLNRHSAELGKSILSEVDRVIGAGISPLLELIAKGMITVLFLVLLTITDPKLALFISISLGGAYIIFFYFLRKYINRIGEDSLKYNELRFKAVSDAFGAIKEIKVGGFEKFYIKLFSRFSRTFVKTEAALGVSSQLPRFILEAVSFGGILLLLLYLINQTGNFNNAIPIISLYVFAAYRLMPALQQVYASFTQLNFVGASLDKLYDDLNNNIKLTTENQDQQIISFNKNIILSSVHYNYPNSSQTSLTNINLNIPAKSKIGLIGTTGSGKTTLIDVILGLIDPQKGTLEIDGQIISENNKKSWQCSIGYVPQQIFLYDDTIAANIAFGIDQKKIDLTVLEKVSKIANLHEFIINELSEQYQTKIGERGIRLSGGQRQRIGIARALYHNPKLLVLDEATSALDNQTEQEVMDSINNLSEEITVIIIAHRLNTLKKCNVIYKLNKGQIIDKLTFDELINNKKN